jgi:poly-gamma-glutamate synthesis protein (capsule biosynthesis protein)
VRELIAWLDPALPPALISQLQLPKGVKRTRVVEQSNLQIGAIRGDPAEQSTWVYALAAAFPTLADGTSLEEIQRAWRGEDGAAFSGVLLMAHQTRAAFEARWGPSSGGRIEEIDADELLDATWSRRSDWAILPFEDLEPRWKILRVDSVSPTDGGFNLADYPLTVWFGITGKPEALQLLAKQQGNSTRLLPAGNRDPQHMTSLIMTGVTALTRATGFKMDTQGTTYPGQDIRDWFLNADFAHISNEVSFNEDCPKANFLDTGTLFCSRPEYIELLDYLGIDIIELSGNHNNDWGRAANSYSLNMYRDRGWSYFGGGANLEEARSPLKIEHNGNRLAFISCNPVGPTGAWATADQPGAAPCMDYTWILEEIRHLRDDGYLPIVTFQYFETYISKPSAPQERDFRAAVDAGAVIISGSQAHFPQTFEFYQERLIHYGLGNLFFDQMDMPVQGTRREFVDRHIFYNGKHIQTELLTALLEDYARPRPMNEDERRNFLSELFDAAGW